MAPVPSPLPQEGYQTIPREPKRAQEAPRGPQDGPKRPPKGPKQDFQGAQISQMSMEFFVIALHIYP